MAYLKLADRFDLLEHAYAHRGLWGKHGPSENSMAAYRAAADAGLGIEIDVRPASDGVPVCFHDLDLPRLTKHEGFVSDFPSSALNAFKLPNGQTIPLLSDLLTMWPHDLPILVELKIDSDTDPVKFVSIVAEQLKSFSGQAAMMSFCEKAVGAVPDIIMRGQLIDRSDSMDPEEFKARTERALASGVDYLALHETDAAINADAPIPTVCWTVCTQEARDRVKALGHAEIFEHLPIPLAAG